MNSEERKERILMLQTRLAKLKTDIFLAKMKKPLSLAEGNQILHDIYLKHKKKQQ